MALTYETSLDVMRHCFPSWSDIRKRTNKSTCEGGALLRSYANEFDRIQEAIDDYQKAFFLVNYYGHETEVIDYLYVANLGIYDDMTIDNLDVDLTSSEKEFLEDPKNLALFAGGYLMVHPDILPAEGYFIYTVSEKYTYKVVPTKQHIWNVFDEFALFAGVKRFENETNKQLAERTYNQFKEFPNSSEQGLKNAIKNALCNNLVLTDDDIQIVPFSKENIDLSSDVCKEFFEALALYNQDLFRTKVWDRSLWEHGFQKTDFIPHVWDEPMEITVDGVGHGDDLRVDYLEALNENDTTDIKVSTYKKSRKAIQEYIRNNNVETVTSLTLKKYGSTIIPKEVVYKLTATSVKKVDTSSILLNSYLQSSGESEFYISDIATFTENITRVDRNHLEDNTQYQLVFQPKENYSDMTIAKCLLSQDSGTTDIRTEYGVYEMRDGTIMNKNVLMHVTSTAGLSRSENIVDVVNGVALGTMMTTGKLGIDVTDMQNKVFSYKISCKEVNITDNTAFVSYSSDFSLSADGKTLTNNSISSLGSIVIQNLHCNSYSFTLDKNSNAVKQGAISVTTVINNKTETSLHTVPQTISRTFSELTEVKIIIKKEGQYPISVSNISMSSYNVKFSMDKGTVIHNPMYWMLPNFSGHNTLYMELEAYSAHPPVIEYIHVGNSLAGAKYVLDFSTETNASIEINSDCNVSLYKMNGNSKTLVSSAYVTQPYYKNDSSTPGYIGISTDGFVAVHGSSIEILKKYKGGPQSYITVLPGQTVEKIKISGDILKRLESKILSTYLFGDNAIDKEVYATKGFGFLLVKDTGTGKISRMRIPRNAMRKTATVFRLANLPSDITAEFMVEGDDTATIIAQETTQKFDALSLSYVNASTSVAYNQVQMLDMVKNGIEIVNTFTPIISMTELFLYQIAPTVNETGTEAVFRRGTEFFSWSLGVPAEGITVTTVMDFQNTDSYELQISYVNDKHILSNEIPLDDSYLVNGMTHDLCEYIVTVQDGIQINYTDMPFNEDILTSSTGFDKLKYSNVSGVVMTSGGSVIPSAAYTILAQEGIIVWNTETYYDKTVHANYIVRKPASIVYTDIDLLYDLVAYNVNAYEFIESFEFHAVTDEQKKTLDYVEQPDKVVTSCTNPSFEATVNNGVMTVVQLEMVDKLAVHNGYIYDSGIEYFYLNDKFIDPTDRFDHVELHNVTRQNGELLFHMRSTNYLPHSNMYSHMLVKLCDMDFTEEPDIFGANSEFMYLTACESFNLWYAVDMDISLSSAVLRNGYGTSFSARGKIGYAVEDVTKYIKKGNILSVYLTGDLKFGLVKEIVQEGMTFAKSVCISAKDVQDFQQEGKYQYYIIEDDPEENQRYYFYVSGTDGSIDDLISMPYTTLEDMEESHTKNIDRFKFAFSETLLPNYKYDLEFDPIGALYDDLSCHSKTMELSTTATVEYGLTKTQTIDLQKCYTTYAEYKKQQLILSGDKNLVRTRSFYTKSHSSIYKLYVKVNEIAVDKYKDFTIKLYGSSTQNGAYLELGSVKKANILAVQRKKLKNYMYIEVSGTNGKVINSIEVYARYAEVGGAKLTSKKKPKGTFISKIYDLGIPANYVFNGVDYDLVSGNTEAVNFYIRGARESSNALIFTDWKLYQDNATDLTQITLNNYRLVQFKAEINNDMTAIKIKNYKMEVTA